MLLFSTDLLGDVFHLAHGRVAVAARHGVDGPTDVDVVLLQVAGVRQIHGLPVAAGAGASQAAGRQRKRRRRVRKRRKGLKHTSLWDGSRRESPGQVVLLQSGRVRHHALVGPFRTRVGRVPAEVIGEVVFNLGSETQGSNVLL